MKFLLIFTFAFLCLPSFVFADCPLGNQAIAVGSYSKALNYYLLCSQRGDIEANYKLASLYYHGKGLKKPNKRRAKKFYASSADEGYLPAQTMYGIINYLGTEDTKGDKVDAYQWFLLASEEQKDRWFIMAPQAKEDEQARKLAVKYISDISKYLTSQEKEQALTKAQRWKEKAIFRTAKRILTSEDYDLFTKEYNSSALSRTKALDNLKTKIEGSKNK